jgi:hypothetical protein
MSVSPRPRRVSWKLKRSDDGFITLWITWINGLLDFVHRPEAQILEDATIVILGGRVWTELQEHEKLISTFPENDAFKWSARVRNVPLWFWTRRLEICQSSYGYP